MSSWDHFPDDYRQTEVSTICNAVHSGHCVALLGLSGAGKSNLLGFLAHRRSSANQPLVLLDCNRLLEHTPPALLQLAHSALGGSEQTGVPFDLLSQAVAARLQTAETVTFLFDRFDIFAPTSFLPLHNVLRALRDAHKYRLAFVFALRQPLPSQSELSELVQGQTVWLGPLSAADARWNVARFARRHGEEWDDDVVEAILEVSRGYPSLLKAACEAVAAGARPKALTEHPAVLARVEEFWRDDPAQEHLEASGLAGHPLLMAQRGPLIATEELTAKEQQLYDYFRAHPGQVCDKDDLIRAVWPEDAVFEEGVRDSSLAQLVRRLRLKIEPDASDPRFIQTVPGRGYLFRPH